MSIDRDTPLLLPPNLRAWVPDDHLVHFLLDAVAPLDRHQVKVNTRGSGSEPYPPPMLLALLSYSLLIRLVAKRVKRRGIARRSRHPMERRLATGFERSTTPSRLQTGAPTH